MVSSFVVSANLHFNVLAPVVLTFICALLHLRAVKYTFHSYQISYHDEEVKVFATVIVDSRPQEGIV